MQGTRGSGCSKRVLQGYGRSQLVGGSSGEEGAWDKGGWRLARASQLRLPGCGRALENCSRRVPVGRHVTHCSWCVPGEVGMMQQP